MLSAPTPKLYATGITAAHSTSALDSLGQNASPAHDTQHSPPQNVHKAPIRHYTTLQEHADRILETDALGQALGATPRHNSRREGFSWGRQPQAEDCRHNQYAMAAEIRRSSSPPTLKEILRRTNIEDADDIQNKIRHVDSMELQPPTTLHSFGSFSTNESDYDPQDHRKSSIVAFAKGIARHVSDLRILYPPDNRQDRQSRGSTEDYILKLQNRDSDLSFASPSRLEAGNNLAQISTPTAVVDEPSKGDEKSIKTSNTQLPAASSGLRARRKVQLDLSMPSNVPDLPARGRYPVETAGNIAAPRPRSPKTPWMCNEQSRWDPDRLSKSSPIKEEDYMSDNIAAMGNRDYISKGLLPDDDTLYSSQAPEFERSQARMGDRYHMMRPLSKRSRSGQSNLSATNASDVNVTQIPDKGLTLAQERMKAQTTADLHQMAQDSKKSRSRRWRWRFTTSSEEGAPSSGSEPSKHRPSMNPFRRSNRLSDQSVLETSRQNANPTHLTGRGKDGQTLSMSLAHMPAPPAFVPPGLSRVPTPPLYDANGEVKGKLADFFFDFQSSDITSNRKKPQPSSEGYWDSDALLMSQSADLTNFGQDEDEEEGPEGPLRNTLQYRSTFGRTGSLKPFAQRSQGFQGIKPPLSPSLSTDSPMLGHDGWYRVNHERDANLRDSVTIAELARQEEEERRKFEWLVPEHLPNSPLCPLHEKYTGPSKGLCYWHGRRSGTLIRRGEYTRPDVWSGSGGGGDDMGAESESEGDSGAGAGRSLGIVTPLAREVKKRRLVSLSSP